MPILSKAQIFSAADRRTEDVDVPEWGGTVRLRNLTSTERDRWDEILQGGGPGKLNLVNVRARLVAMSMVDEQGKDVEFSAADLAALGAKDGAVMDRLFDACARLSKIGPKAIEEAKKNSGPGPSEGSSSSSPAPGSTAPPPSCSTESAPTS